MPSFTIDTSKLIPKAASGAIYPKLLTFFGLAGVIFYAIGPILFPHAPIREPELLPVYTLMMGLGQLLKKGDIDTDDDGDTKGPDKPV